MTEGVVGVLLAAGYSTRFGGNKLLQPLQDGASIAVASGRNLLPVVDQGVAVVHAGDEQLSCLLAQCGYAIVVNKRAKEGIGRSIACGVAATRHARGWLIALADMPFISVAIHQRVADAMDDGAAIAAPRYGNSRGHPVGFSDTFYAQLTRLRGDEGARSLLEQYADVLTLIDVDDPAVLTDIDRASQLE